MNRRNQQKTEEQATRFLILSVVVAVALLASIFYLAVTRLPRKQHSVQAQAQSGMAVPPYYETLREAMPLPATLDPKKFTRQAVVQAYTAAREIAGVLAQQPCYCGCQRRGHRSLLDCFTDEHAVTCNICLKEAIFAGQLHKQGKKPDEIREAILRGEWKTVRLT